MQKQSQERAMTSKACNEVVGAASLLRYWHTLSNTDQNDYK